jgi:hypothetical protein
MYKVGDKVFYKKFGHGKVIAINRTHTYPIIVEFAHETASFTLECKWFSNDIKGSLAKIGLRNEK